MISRHTALAPLTTFGVQASAESFCAVTAVEQLVEAIRFAEQAGLPWFVIGGGSNLLFVDDYPGMIIQMVTRGIELLTQDEDSFLVRVQAGENWHDFVQHSLQQGWYGLENLALIPGSVGAAPVQNIGAYGVEIEQFIHNVELYDPATGQQQTLSRAECGFAYRDSRFKRAGNSGGIIVAVTFRLLKMPRINSSYATLAEVLTADADPHAVFSAVCAIRRARLPDPHQIGNAGSFFKNPLVTLAQRDALQQQYPNLPWFPVAGQDGHCKIAAAWLIEQSGWKGQRQGDAGVYERQALVLVNHGNASGQQMLALAREIAESVQQRFNISLEPEVRILPPLDRFL